MCIMKSIQKVKILDYVIIKTYFYLFVIFKIIKKEDISK